jgi:hypothetical protein
MRAEACEVCPAGMRAACVRSAVHAREMWASPGDVCPEDLSSALCAPHVCASSSGVSAACLCTAAGLLSGCMRASSVCAPTMWSPAVSAPSVRSAASMREG